jgi:phosphate starvation-inducible PhoH-like protein
MDNDDAPGLALQADQQRIIFGTRDGNLRSMEKAFGVKVQARGDRLSISGEPGPAAVATRLLGELAAVMETGYPLTERDIQDAIRIVSKDPGASLTEFYLKTTVEPMLLKLVQPRSLRQKQFLESIAGNDMVFSVGPAGTGKTYLSVGMACAYFLEHRVRRIVLTRPAVEAGERLGFLPGDILQKVDPYLRPLYDALYDIMGYERVLKLIEKGFIEIAPLAFMRGRTLNEAFIILDEGQNTTPEQMKMFLTRMGFASKVVITGDITQIDLPAGKESGLKHARRILRGVPGMAFIEFDERDVVRHNLVAEIIAAYERGDRA